MILFAVALASGSQTNVVRLNLRNCTFSFPGVIVASQSSKDVLGIGASDSIGLPIEMLD
jgi:hypothetical protein